MNNQNNPGGSKADQQNRDTLNTPGNTNNQNQPGNQGGAQRSNDSANINQSDSRMNPATGNSNPNIEDAQQREKKSWNENESQPGTPSGSTPGQANRRNEE